MPDFNTNKIQAMKIRNWSNICMINRIQRLQHIQKHNYWKFQVGNKNKIIQILKKVHHQDPTEAPLDNFVLCKLYRKVHCKKQRSRIFYIKKYSSSIYLSHARHSATKIQFRFNASHAQMANKHIEFYNSNHKSKHDIPV